MSDADFVRGLRICIHCGSRLCVRRPDGVVDCVWTGWHEPREDDC